MKTGLFESPDYMSFPELLCICIAGRRPFEKSFELWGKMVKKIPGELQSIIIQISG